MKKYEPKALVAVSRYQNYFPSLPIRTRTLCQGGDLCDFRFVRHSTDAGDGWERSKSICYN